MFGLYLFTVHYNLFTNYEITVRRIFTKIKSLNKRQLWARIDTYLYCQAGTVLPCAGMFTTEHAESFLVGEVIDEIFPTVSPITLRPLGK